MVNPLNVLAFFAHPDDETMLAGGTLALLSSAGARVYYLMATRGEGGETGEPPVCVRSELGQVRQAELECAVQALGGAGLTFLGYTDPVIGEGDEMYSYTGDLERLEDQVAEHLQRLQIGAVLTHGSDGEYGHPAHVTTHQAARRAVTAIAHTRPAPALYTVSASFPAHPKPRLANPSDPAHLVLDITPVLARKIQAALCHQSQHALFVRRASEEAGHALQVPDVIASVESLHHVNLDHQAGAHPSNDPLAVLLQPWTLPF